MAAGRQDGGEVLVAAWLPDVHSVPIKPVETVHKEFEVGTDDAASDASKIEVSIVSCRKITAWVFWVR
jgi:hypothetical protein